MKELVVLSGKGGTGKTSVSGALAYLLGKNALLGDCDVDASNLHLVTGAKNTISEDFFSGCIAEINNLKCTNCGRCANICRFNAIEYINNTYVINPMHCEGCGYCYEICPKEAIILNPGHTGYLKVSETRFGSTLVHASLNIGAENSGKLVSRVREKLNQIADDSNANLIITDGSPGIGCPVIATITGASHILIVTEPGMSALHDMERLIKLAQAFKISVSCIINKYDIENDLTKNIEEYLKQNNIPLWGKLPYNDVFRIAASDLKTAPELNHELINKEFKKIVEFVKNTLL